nr:MAG TPA: hypothetical protein [Caudoviricetes sp.]
MLIPEIQTIRGSALYNPVSLHSVLYKGSVVYER